MREPPQTSERRGPERRSGLRGQRLKAVILIGVAAISVFALEIVVNRESHLEDSTVLTTPPEGLVGKWVTENPGYSDRALVIGNDHIELHLGAEGGIQSHAILSIRAAQGPDSWAYEIDYEVSGGKSRLAVNLHPDGVLRLKNPANMVWRREPAN